MSETYRYIRYLAVTMIKFPVTLPVLITGKEKITRNSVKKSKCLLNKDTKVSKEKLVDYP